MPSRRAARARTIRSIAASGESSRWRNRSAWGWGPCAASKRRVELARDMPGTLDQGADGQAGAEQPVQAGDVGPHVAAHQDRALAGGDRAVQVLAPADLESGEHRDVGAQVERVVAGQEPRRVGRQLGPERSDRSRRARARPARASRARDRARPSAPAGPTHAARPRRAEYGVGPGRPEEPERGQQELVEDELPAEDPAKESVHEPGPRSAAIDFSRW